MKKHEATFVFPFLSLFGDLFERLVLRAPSADEAVLRICWRGAWGQSISDVDFLKILRGFLYFSLLTNLIPMNGSFINIRSSQEKRYMIAVIKQDINRTKTFMNRGRL